VIVSIDPVTAAISAERISKINFDKLLLAHQDSPVRLRRRDSIISDITSLVIGNHTDCTVNMVFNMYEQLH
jgi:hypothetical protein